MIAVKRIYVVQVCCKAVKLPFIWHLIDQLKKNNNLTVTLAKIMGKCNRKTAVGPHTKPLSLVHIERNWRETSGCTKMWLGAHTCLLLPESIPKTLRRKEITRGCLRSAAVSKRGRWLQDSPSSALWKQTINFSFLVVNSENMKVCLVLSP